MARLLRNWHRWVSLVVALPFLVTVTTGILLATRGFNTYMQPDYPEFNAGLTISFERILDVARSVPEAKIKSWSDVSQIDIRPASGNIRVRSKHNHWEIQMKGDTGEITSSAPRRVSFFIQLHEGSYWGPGVRYGIFLTSAVGMLFLLLSGVYLALRHYVLR
ncbi:MAG: PepSY domain-containing protein [Bdellovibrionaceae bacterium]|nr:PepSY domain-containing protein [Pseudobdellovibrionaceae bacterium]